MKTIKTLHASVPNKLYRLLSLGMVAFLLVGAFMVARPAQAAVTQTCTTNADGDWSDPIWDCGPIPTSTDDVVIVNEVTIHTDQAVHSLSINPYGILQFTAPATLTLNGNFAKDALAIFDPGNDFGLPSDPSTGGTVAFGPGDHTITTNGEVVDFYNLTKIASGANEKLLFDPQGSGGGFVHVMNSLTLKGVAGTLLSLASTVPGTQWGIESEWTTDVNYVDVQDFEQSW